jgi:hypothetical protein
MSEHAIKKRMARARKLAAEDLRRAGYGIIETRGGPFAIIAVRLSEARFVRVVVDDVQVCDIHACKQYPVPSNCIREVWALGPRERHFQIKSA